jgi:thiol-disulfide isomerase/thioredoxin
VALFCDDEGLDRSIPCSLTADPSCGYPGGAIGYEVGQVAPNFVLLDCGDAQVEFAEFLNERPDTGSCNRGVIVGLSAIWCAPCSAEAELFADLVPDWRGEGIEFVELVYQDDQGDPPTVADCVTWYEDSAQEAFTVLYDPTDSIDDDMLLGGNVLPVHLSIDANGHVRSRGASMVTEAQILTEIALLVDDPYGN